MAEVERPLRRDAERNRLRILAAAREVFAGRGLDATMDDVAHHAGVGVGTVYRRFPNKDVLIEALFEERIGEVVAVAERALEHEDPWEGFVSLLGGMLAMQADDLGLKRLLQVTEPGQERLASVRQRMAPLVSRVVERAQAAGELRPDFHATDVPVLNVMLGAAADFTRGADPDAWRRQLAMLLDGLRVRGDGPSPLPGPPLGFEGVAQAMASWRAD